MFHFKAYLKDSIGSGGSSGTPFTFEGTLYGFGSAGASAGCAAGYPSVITRIHYYLSWIEDKTGLSPPSRFRLM